MLADSARTDLPRFSACRRRLHLDYHNPPGIPDLACDFDPAEFAATVAAAGFDSATVFAQDSHGHSYFSTRVGVPHPYLQRDLLGEMVAALHEHGLTVGAYISVGCSDYADRAWWQVSPDGSPRSLEGGGGYTMVCLNSPYVEENVLPLSREVLQRYPVDALWYDLLFFYDEGCHCPWCRARMERLGLNTASAQDVREHMRGSVGEFADKVARLIGEVRPGVEFTLNGLSLHERPAGLEHAAYVDVEALATGGWGYFYVPTKCRYLLSLGKPVTGMTAAFHESWGGFGTLKARALLEHEVYTVAATGAEVAIGDQLPPRGRLEPARYERIGEVLRPLRDLDPWLAGAQPLAEAAILLPPGALGQFPSPAWVGACKLLMEAKVQFTTVDRQADWSPYRLLVLPDDAYRDEATCEKLATYLGAGGSLLATGEALAALPASLVRVAGEATGGPAYLRVVGNWAREVPDMPHVVLSGLTPLDATGAEVLATLTLPYPPREEHFYFSSPQVAYAEDTSLAVTVHSSNVIALGAPLFAEYAQRGYGAHRQLLQAALRRLLPEPLVSARLPLSCEVALFQQGDQVVCLLVPYAPVRGDGIPQIEEWPMLADLTVGVRGDFDGVYVAPERLPLPCHRRGPYTLAGPLLLQGPAAIVFE